LGGGYDLGGFDPEGFGPTVSKQGGYDLEEVTTGMPGHESQHIRTKRVMRDT